MTDPRLNEFFAALTGPAEPGELVGEPEALAAFRSRPAVGDTIPISVPGPARPDRAASLRWRAQLVAACVLVLCGGLAAAAYATALPSPVQHVVHQVFQFAGVPDTGPGRASGRPGGSRPGATLLPAMPGPVPAPSASAGSGSLPASSSAPGSATLTVSVRRTVIPAGSAVVISGQLTWPGHAVGGLVVTAAERPAGTAAWRAAGSGDTDSAGNVAVTVPAVTTSAVFRLTAANVATSAAVRVVVVPVVAVVLQTGPAGEADVLAVGTQYAQRGDAVALQVASASGAWTTLRSNALGPDGRTVFVLGDTRLRGAEVRVLLAATIRHAAAASAPVSVPA